MEFEIHPTQAEILMFLLFTPEATYTQLNVTGLETDHLNFHVKRLISTGLIEKNENNHYQLTVKGKEFANRFDTEQAQIERQAKIAVVIIATRKKGTGMEYLIQQRLKQPYYGFYGFITGKIRWGDLILDAAARELKEETGLQAHLRICGIRHKMDYDTSSYLLEDKYKFIIHASSAKGKLIERFEGGKNKWMTKDAVFTKENVFPDVEESIKIIAKNDFILTEGKYTVDKY